MYRVNKPTCKPVYRRKKINVICRLRVGPYSDENCDLGRENAALGQWPRGAFSRPRSQFFTKRTSQPANYIHVKVSLFNTCYDSSVLSLMQVGKLFTYCSQMTATIYAGPYQHTPHHHVHQKLKSKVNYKSQRCSGNKNGLLAVVTLHGFVLGKLDLLTVSLEKLKFASVTDFSLCKLPPESFVVWGSKTARERKNVLWISLDNYPKNQLP